VGSSEYSLENVISSLGDTPEDATLSFSGAEFPAFSDVPIPVVDRVTDGVASNVTDAGYLNADSDLTWSKPSNEDTFVRLELSSSIFNDDGTSVDQGEVSVNCIAVDDGEFKFPNEVKEVLSQYNFSVGDTRLYRGIMSSTRRGDAMVLTNSFTTYVFVK